MGALEAGPRGAPASCGQHTSPLDSGAVFRTSAASAVFPNKHISLRVGDIRSFLLS